MQFQLTCVVVSFMLWLQFSRLRQPQLDGEHRKPKEDFPGRGAAFLSTVPLFVRPVH